MHRARPATPQVPIAQHVATINVNLNGVMIGTYCALPLLKKAAAAGPGKAHIINMASSSAFYGTPQYSSYSASKCAIRGLTECLNIELAPLNVVVSDIAPPIVSTPMVANNPESHASKQGVGSLKLVPVITPEAVAKKCWQAAHAQSSWSVHRVMDPGMALLTWLGNIIPFLSRFMMMMIAMPRRG